MKRYVVVAWHQYYPYGGLENIKATFDTFEEADSFAQYLTLPYRYDGNYRPNYDHSEVVDLETYVPSEDESYLKSWKEHVALEEEVRKNEESK